MRCRFGSDAKRGLRGEHGAIAVEFAIILPVLLLLVFGIVDLGHAWYMKHLMSDASREGARYASRYWTVGTTRILPKDLTPSVTNYVLLTSAENSSQGGWGLTRLLPSDANPQVTPGGPGATWTNATTVAGKDLIVTITATKTWFVLGKLIPTLGSSKILSVTTTMTCE
ncbi:MAG: pilus assembly protein [Syntrophobacterales bacterium]|jgi:Flp pilus assembly protein TadG|nr:pilus assembly protein [Syntrophobacterales bacterium]